MDARGDRPVAAKRDRRLRNSDNLLERRAEGIVVRLPLPAGREPLRAVRGQEPLGFGPDVHGPDERPAGVGCGADVARARCGAARPGASRQGGTGGRDDAQL
eukprot:1877258-Prymnesium_polylepis.1